MSLRYFARSVRTTPSGLAECLSARVTVAQCDLRMENGQEAGFASITAALRPSTSSATVASIEMHQLVSGTNSLAGHQMSLGPPPLACEVERGLMAQGPCNINESRCCNQRKTERRKGPPLPSDRRVATARR